MGDASEEAAAYDKIIQAGIQREADALKAADAARAEAERKAAEAANGQNSMTADGTTGGTAVGWPDNEVRAEPGRLTQAAGKLGLGKAGDAELAKRLLNDGQPAPGSRGAASGDAGKGAVDTVGARAKAAGVRGAKPALGH